jgi:heme exporter protein A
MISLKVHQLNCIREERLVFSNVSLSLKEGEALYIKGANGSGKTSFLKMLAGLLKTNPCHLEWQNLKSSSNLIFLASHFPGKPYLTVQENLRFWATLYGHPDSENVDKALKTFGIFSFKTNFLSSLSLGQQQRLNLARLLIHKAKVWLLDEPTLSLDEEGKEILAKTVKNHLNQGGITIIAGHDNIFRIKKILNLDGHQTFSSNQRRAYEDFLNTDEI